MPASISDGSIIKFIKFDLHSYDCPWATVLAVSHSTTCSARSTCTAAVCRPTMLFLGSAASSPRDETAANSLALSCGCGWFICDVGMRASVRRRHKLCRGVTWGCAWPGRVGGGVQRNTDPIAQVLDLRRKPSSFAPKCPNFKFCPPHLPATAENSLWAWPLHRRDL